jgi:hypothetical protein
MARLCPRGWDYTGERALVMASREMGVTTVFTTRAFLYDESGGFYRIFKDFMHRVGYRETVTFQDAQQVVEAIRSNVWPVIFIDANSDGMFDSLGFLDRLYMTPGFELLPFVVFGLPEDRRTQLYAKAVGARGHLQRPLAPGDATQLVKPLLADPCDKWVALALEVSKLLLADNFEGARNGLVQLVANPAMERGAEVALLRGEIALGQFSRAEERLIRLLKKFPGDLRMYCEAAEYFKATHQIVNAVRFIKEIEKTRALPHRTWDRVCMSVEMDDLNGAVDALEELNRTGRFRPCALRGYVQLFLSLGLHEHVPRLLSSNSVLARQYLEFQTRSKKPSEGLPA